MKYIEPISHTLLLSIPKGILQGIFKRERERKTNKYYSLKFFFTFFFYSEEKNKKVHAQLVVIISNQRKQYSFPKKILIPFHACVREEALCF